MQDDGKDAVDCCLDEILLLMQGQYNKVLLLFAICTMMIMMSLLVSYTSWWCVAIGGAVEQE